MSQNLGNLDFVTSSKSCHMLPQIAFFATNVHIGMPIGIKNTVSQHMLRSTWEGQHSERPRQFCITHCDMHSIWTSLHRYTLIDSPCHTDPQTECRCDKILFTFGCSNCAISRASVMNSDCAIGSAVSFSTRVAHSNSTICKPTHSCGGHIDIFTAVSSRPIASSTSTRSGFEIVHAWHVAPHPNFDCQQYPNLLYILLKCASPTKWKIAGYAETHVERTYMQKMWHFYLGAILCRRYTCDDNLALCYACQ